MEYYLPIEKKEILASLEATQMGLEIIVLNKISQAQKVSTAKSHLYVQPKKVGLIEVEREW
jgi:hypothetical protein